MDLIKKVQIEKITDLLPTYRYSADNHTYDSCVLGFNSAKEAAQSFGRPKDSHIGDCCKGRRKTCFGYGWRYER